MTMAIPTITTILMRTNMAMRMPMDNTYHTSMGDPRITV
jgi:hypothetical protein